MDSPTISVDDQSAKSEPRRRSALLGGAFFFVSLVIYCVNTFLVKQLIDRFGLTALEATYMVSAPLLPVGYLVFKTTAPGNDLLAVPNELVWVVLGRCICGFLSDVTLYTAFTHTAYSRAFSLSKLDTLFFPFIACLTLGDNIRPADYIGLAAAGLGSLLIFKSIRTKETFKEEARGLSWSVLASVIGALLFVFCRKLGDKIHYSIPLMYYLTLSSICAPLLSLLHSDE